MFADIQCLEVFNACRCSIFANIQCWQMFNDFMCLGTPILKVFNHSWCSMFAGVQSNSGLVINNLLPYKQ